MSGIWLNIQVASIIFLLVLVLIALRNTRVFSKLGTYPEPPRFPRVSIMVPARNEEANIASCILSLLAQDYPDFEVIVLDDDSTDRTWNILEAFSTKDKRLRIIKGKPLPDGWLGKHWACHQMAQMAQGELLLFTDADTRHSPRTLREAVAAYHKEQADFLTALPKEEARTLGEKLTIPIMPFGINSFLPVELAHRTSWSLLSIAVGQFMLFRRKAYEELGGYEAVRQCVLDDVELARRVKSHGMRFRIVDASNHVSCRMYTSLEEVYDGFSKNLFATFGQNILIYIPVWLWLTTVFILPVVILGLAVSGAKVSDVSVILALISVGCSLILWGISNIRFGYPLYLTFLYPLSVSLWVLMAARSMIATIARLNTWKGRRIDIADEPLEESEDLERFEDKIP